VNQEAIARAGLQSQKKIIFFEERKFIDSRHVKVVRVVSPPPTAAFILPGNIPGTHLCYRLSQQEGLFQ
jgi:hypothetical protein